MENKIQDLQIQEPQIFMEAELPKSHKVFRIKDKQYHRIAYDYSVVPAGSAIETAKKLHSVRFLAGATPEITKQNRETALTLGVEAHVTSELNSFAMELNEQRKRWRCEEANTAVAFIRQCALETMAEDELRSLNTESELYLAGVEVEEATKKEIRTE